MYSMMLYLFSFKSKMLLAQITKSYYKNRCYYFRNYRIHVHLLDKKFQKHIVESNTSQNHRKVSNQLNSSPQITFAKNKVTAVIKTYWKSYTKCSNHSSNVRTDCEIPKMHYAILLEFIFKNTKKKNIEKCICTTARSISKSLQWHKPLKQGIEKINDAK